MRRSLLYPSNGLLLNVIVCIFVFAASFSIQAQSITNYTFSAGSTAFTTLSGASSVSLIDDNTGWPSADDGKANGLPIGFDFWYMGVRYTTASISSNGWMTLGANITNSTFTNNMSSGGAPRPVIAPLWDDLNMQSSSNVTYATTGAEGSRIFTVEYLNAKWDYDASGPRMSFQVKLYEMTGMIEFIYQRVGGNNPNNPSASIGITSSATGNNTYLSLNTAGTAVSSTSETNNISSRPATNQRYRFTPATPNAPSNLTFSNVVYNGMRLNWTDNSSNEQGFALYRSDDGGLTYNFVTQTASNTTNYTQTGLSENTLYYWRVYAVTEGGLSAVLSGSQSTCLRPSQPSAFLTSADNVCRNQTGVGYSIASVTGATSYAWTYSGTGETITGGTSNTISVNFSNTASSGNISVSSVNSCGTSNPLTIAVVVSNAVPGRPGNFTTNSSTVCQGQTGVAYVSGTSSNATSYTWSYSGSGATINGSSNSITLDFSNTATAGTLTVNGTNACGNSTQNRSTAIAINPLPAQPGAYTTSSAAICLPQSNVAYTLPTVAGATSYAWNYTGTGATISNGTTRSITIDFAANATSGTLNGAAVNACGTGIARAINITVNTKPLISQIPTTGLIANYRLNGNADDATGNNNGTLQNAPTSTTDRFGNANSAYSFNGTTQYISTSIPYNNPSLFTMSIWFKTTSTAGGKLIGVGNAQTGSSGQYDRHIYMSNSGQLYFGVYPGGVRTINSSASYNDGNWHMATVSLSSNGMKLYADGVLLSSDATTTTAENYTGYLKIGFDNNNGWTDQPGNFYFNGSLDDILIYSTELNATQVATLYNSPDGAGNNGPVCAGTTLTFSATSISGATYAWTGPNSFASSSQNPTLSYTSVATGTYTLTVTHNGCSSTAYTNASPKTSDKGKWIGGINSNWANTNNWCDMSIPTAATDVVIASTSSNMPVMAGNAYANNLTINSGATLYNSSTGILNLSGNFNNNGTFTDNGIYTDAGKIMFVGSSNQSINGVTTFNNMTINNASGVTLNSTATINGILTLTTGTFTTNNNLNQNLYNGAIAGTGTGTTSGNIRFFKTIWGDKYHYISSPISGNTVSDWNDNVTLKLGPTAYNLYTYNETMPDSNKQVGWIPVTSSAAPIQSMKGYSLYFPRWTYNTLLDVNGAYTHGATYSTSLTNTPSTTPVNKPASDGWNLVGNPYPSTIDWKAATGWTKTNIDDAIYTWDGRTNKYVSFVNNVGSNGGTRYIGSMQGFFVKVTGASTGTLTMTNAVRTTSILYDVWRTEEEEIGDIFRLTAASGEFSDETVIRFKSDATTEFDTQLDAYKLLNGGSSPSLFSVSGDVDYSINSLPNNVFEKTIPLSIVTGFAGRYTLTADFSQFQGEQSIWLEDKLLGTLQNLREDNVYSVNLEKGAAEGRFFIQYQNQEARTVTGNTEQSASNGIEISSSLQTVSILFPNTTGKANIAVFDALGKNIYTIENAAVQSGKINIQLPNAETGIYIVKVHTAMANETQQVYINK